MEYLDWYNRFRPHSGINPKTPDEAYAAVPPGYQVVAMIPIGYPDNDPSPPKRREASEFTHNEKF